MKHQSTLLLGLLAFVFLTILPAVLFLLVRPAVGLYSLSLSVLSYSVFKKFFMLYFFLSIVIGSISFITFISVLKHIVNATLWCYLTSLGILVWLITGMLLAGQINWVHLVYFVAGFLILLLTDKSECYKLPHFNH